MDARNHNFVTQNQSQQNQLPQPFKFQSQRQPHILLSQLKPTASKPYQQQRQQTTVGDGYQHNSNYQQRDEQENVTAGSKPQIYPIRHDFWARR